MTLREVRAELKALANPEIAAHSQRFFKTGPGEYGEGDRFLGIRVPRIRALAKRCRGLTLDQANSLLQARWHEERLLAVIILTHHFARGGDSERRAICELYLANTHRVNNWDLVDASAHLIVGPWLQDRPRDLLRDLARSESLWERRIAMMATYCYIRQDDYADALDIAEMLLADEHDLIHKICGWMLREIGKRDQAVAEEFLQDHGHRMPRTMLRYAIEKYPEDLRQRYLRGDFSRAAR